MAANDMETQIAVIGQKLDQLLEERHEAKESRKVQYTATENLRLSVQAIEFRMVAVEKTVAEHAPTLQEFTALKFKVQGAGVFGRFLWALAGLTIGAAAYTIAHIKAWIGV